MREEKTEVDYPLLFVFRALFIERQRTKYNIKL